MNSHKKRFSMFSVMALASPFLHVMNNQNGNIRLGFNRTMLQDPNKGEGGGNGGGSTADLEKRLDGYEKTIQRLQSQIGRMKGGNGGQPGNNNPGKNTPEAEKSLFEKARNDKTKTDKDGEQASDIEKAVSFNLSVNEFYKGNKDILPGEVEEIIKLADKENFDTANAKANAIKVGIIEAFFEIESNLELLTPNQKNQLAEFKKLTKNGREEKASSIYENVFESAVEILKRVKKAEELAKSKNGQGTPTNTQESYIQRLKDQAKRSHLKEKKS